MSVSEVHIFLIFQFRATPVHSYNIFCVRCACSSVSLPARLMPCTIRLLFPGSIYVGFRSKIFRVVRLIYIHIVSYLTDAATYPVCLVNN